MNLLETVKKLEEISGVLRQTFPSAFPREVRAGVIMQQPRSAWQVRLASGANSLDKAIEKLKSAVAEAE